MSTEAKIILTAQDRTASAFRSAQSGLASVASAATRVNSALGAIGVGLSLGVVTAQIASAAKSAIQFGDEMQKAAARTGIGASRFATLADAAKQADVDVGALSKGLKAMQVAVSEAGTGAKGPLTAFRALGIEFESFRRLNPEQQFLKLADQISRLQDPADRVRASVELFGKAGADLLPFFEGGAQGIQAAREEIERLGLALSDEEIKALADADDAIKRLDQSTGALSRSLTALIAGPLTTFLDRLTLIAQTIKREGLFATWGDLSAASDAQQMARARLSANAAFPDARQGPRGRGRSAGATAAPGYTSEPPKPPKGTADADPLSSVQIYAREMFNLANAQEQAIAEINDASLSSNRRFLADISNETNDTLAELAERSRAAAAAINDGMSVYAEQAARNIQTAFADFLFDPFDKGIKGMLAGFVDTVRRMIAEAAAAEILKGFFSWGASAFGGSVGGFFGTMASSIGTRATGGPVSAGKPYLVGERGPELFMPGMSGSIVPNAAMAGGGITINQSFDVRGADADRIMAVMPSLLKRAKDEAVAEIRDLKTRGRL